MVSINRKKFNVTLLGEKTVGKTSLVQVLDGKPFNDTMLSTIGIDFSFQSATFDGKKYDFKIFDTAGQERFKSITGQTLKISDGFLLIFSVDKKSTFELVDQWIDSIKKNVDITKKVLILVGNKIDLENREISNEEAMNYAKENNIKYFETSAKTGLGIKEVFGQLYSDIYQLNKSLQSSNDEKNNEGGIKLDNKDFKKPKRKCCLF